jgi:hypothetical protein
MAKAQSLSRDLLAGAAGGIAGTLMSGVVDNVLGKAIGRKTVAKGPRSGHSVAADAFAKRVFGEDERARKLGHLAFGALFGAGWGLVHGALRRKVPVFGRIAGVPFAVPFYLACDGGIAPLAKLAPPITKIPWSLNAKEIADHVAWATTSELMQRAARRFFERRA